MPRRKGMPPLRMWRIGEGQEKHRPLHWDVKMLDRCSLALLLVLALALQQDRWATERGRKGGSTPEEKRSGVGGGGWPC